MSCIITKQLVAPHTDCPAIANCTSITQIATALLNCRGFLWDSLMDGAYTGCKPIILDCMVKTYGVENVLKAFEEAE